MGTITLLATLGAGIGGSGAGGGVGGFLGIRIDGNGGYFGISAIVARFRIDVGGARVFLEATRLTGPL